MPVFIQLQITFPDKAEAETLAGKLLEQKRIACAQIIGPVASFYWWRGNPESDEEYLMLAKTRADWFASISAIVEKEHSYECPQIVAVPLSCISVPYEKWLTEQLS